MAGVSKVDFEDPTLIDAEEDETTLAAIDEALCDAGAGRLVPLEDVRKLLSTWTTESSAPKKR